MFRHQKRIALAIVIVIVAALAISLVGTATGPSSQGIGHSTSNNLRG